MTNATQAIRQLLILPFGQPLPGQEAKNQPHQEAIYPMGEIANLSLAIKQSKYTLTKRVNINLAKRPTIILTTAFLPDKMFTVVKT